MRVYSNKYHKIWFDNPNLCDDYFGILKYIASQAECRGREIAAGQGVDVPVDPRIRDLVEEERTKGEQSGVARMLPLFVMPKAKEKCRRAMQWLMREAGAQFPFQLYNLDYYFFKLTCCYPFPELQRAVPTISLAEAHLAKDVFLYTRGVLCE